MSDLTDKFAHTEGVIQDNADETHSQLTSMGGTLENIQSAIDGITAQLLLMQRGLSAQIGASSPCVDCSPSQLLPPPLDTTDNPIGSDKCKRTQAFIAFIRSQLTMMDTLSGFSIPLNPTLILNGIKEVITSIGGTDSPPDPSFAEYVQMGGDMLSWVASNLLTGDSLVALFDTVASDISAAIYAAPPPSGIKDAYTGVVNSASFSSYAKAVINDAAYAGAVNYFFDPSSMPDLSAYTGTECGTLGCFTIDSQPATASGFTRNYIVWEAPFTGSNTGGTGTTWDKPVWLAGDYEGARISLVSAGTRRIVVNPGPSQFTSFITHGTPYVLPGTTTYLLLDDTFNDGSFTIEICTAGSF